MPRRYNARPEGRPKADTRARIVAAGPRDYRDRGLAGASNLAVARAADVAPATVRNHFPETCDCWRTVFEGLLEELHIPTPAIFDGLGSLRRSRRAAGPRVGGLLREGASPGGGLTKREPDLIRAWGGGVDQYYAEIERLMRAALGELSSDERSAAVVASVIGPPAFFALRARGCSRSRKRSR